MLSEHRNRVFQVLNSVPPGRVVSYGQLARMAGLGRAARQVGQILRSLPEDTRIPWHRVLSVSGKISLPEPGRSRQIERLQAEAVAVLVGRVDMHRYCWNPETETGAFGDEVEL